MKLKFKNIFLINFLAIASVFGAFSAVVASQKSGDNQVVEKAEAATSSVTLAGSFNSWSTTANPLTLSGDYWYIQTSFAANDTFKVVVNGSDWVGDGDGVTWCSGMGSEGKGNNFKVSTAGCYRIKAAKTIGDYGDKSYGIVFEIGTTTLSFDKQSGTGGTSSTTATYGSSMPSIELPTRDGYTFGGYFTSTGGSGTKYYNSDGTSATNWNLADTTKTLYAKWTISSYTITYHRNDEHTTGNTYSAGTFNYNASHKVLSIDESPISWGSSYLRTFEKWNTASNGTGEDYYPGDTFTVPAKNTTLYSIQRWHTFQCSSNNGSSWTTLTTSSLTGYLVQFEPSSDMTLTAGVPLKFRYQPYGSAVWTEISNSKIAYSGNYGESGVSINAAAKVYLKVPNEYTVGEYQCYVAGLSDLTAVVTHNGVPTYFGGYEDGKDPGGNMQFRISGYLYCHAGDTLKADYQGNNLHDVYLENEDAGFNRGTPTTCAVSGAYVVYLKSKDGGYSWNDVYVSRDEAASAKYFAQIFNTTLSPICTAVSAGTKELSDIQSVWGATASTGLRGEYADFSSGTKAYFKGGTSTSDTDILACIEKYNYIENKYGTTALPNFMERTDPYKPAISNFSPFTLFANDEDNLSTVIIIVSSSIALLSITALSILVIKKRKQKEE